MGIVRDNVWREWGKCHRRWWVGIVCTDTGGGVHRGATFKRLCDDLAPFVAIQAVLLCDGNGLGGNVAR